ncbi:MAG: glycosyltransferase family 2 protein [Nanoarchaeota archaeon]
MKNPLISVIIAAFNEEKKISKCLNALLNQTIKDIEIFVVDDGSTDSTVSVVREFERKNKNIHLLQQKRQGPGAAKNLATKKAKGSILVFVDSDEYPRKDYLEKLIYPIIKNKSETAIGAWVVANPKSVWARCRFNDTYKIRQHALESGVFRAIKAETFFKTPGFDPKKGYSDDRIASGLKRERIDDAIFDHDVDSALKEIYGKRKWIGSSLVNNPKGKSFKIKFSFSIIAIALFIASLFFSRTLSLIMIIIAILPIIYQTLKKAIFYKDIRLIFCYPPYLFICLLGMLSGLLKPVYRN